MEYVKELKKIFGKNFTNDPFNKIVYSHDLGELPENLRKLLGIRKPEGIVRVFSKEDIKKLIDLSLKYNFNLIPRAKATSGYGGVLAVRENSIVVDISWMNRVKNLDKDNLTVTVEPGVVWKNLDEFLKEHNLTLRLYPSSYPSSTVGGWLSQGGAGYGSYKYGWFKENVVSAKVILPNGEEKLFSGEDLLNFVADVQGITGFITEITLKIKERENELVDILMFENEKDLGNALKYIYENKLPFWNVSILNPDAIKLKNIVNKRFYKNSLDLPEKYYLILVYFENEKEIIRKHITVMKNSFNAQLASEDIALHEWNERFKPMKIKKLGPTLIPTEVVLPIKNIDKFFKEVKSAIKHPIFFEGFCIRDGNVVLLGFLPSDIRSKSYQILSTVSITISKIGENLGGREISPGYYFTHKAKDILGEEKIAKLKSFKRRIDPRNIMNPLKIIEENKASKIMKLANINEIFIKNFVNMFKAFDENTKYKDEKNIPGEIIWNAYACTRCSYCIDNCTQYQGYKWEATNPRGKWILLREYIEGRLELSQDLVDLFLGCTLCSFCDVECQIDLPIVESWDKMREILVYKNKFSAFPALEVMAAALKKENNIWAGPQKDRDAWIPEDLKKYMEENRGKTDILYFAGCTTAFVENDVGIGAMRLMKDAGIKFTNFGKQEACCGMPMVVAGKKDLLERMFEHHTKLAKEMGIKTIVTSCPSCYKVWSKYYKKIAEEKGVDYPFEIKHFSELLAEAIKDGRLKFEKSLDDISCVTYHDTCKLGRGPKITEPPRILLKAIPGLKLVEMKHNRDKTLCCGGAGTLVKNPKVAHEVGYKKLKEALDAGAEALVTICPCCEFKLRVDRNYLVETKKIPYIKIMDLATILAKAKGYDLKDPEPWVKELWFTFEAMINIMEPPNMAKFMAEYLPQMIEAMPEPFRSMMKAMEKLPKSTRKIMFSMMKPLMPKLFPMLLDDMMPKLLPIFLKGMEKKIPMPEFLKEQMPDLMPEVMKHYMRGYLPKIIEYFMPYMENYLVEGKTFH